jgi:hypothetical protein
MYIDIMNKTGCHCMFAHVMEVFAVITPPL